MLLFLRDNKPWIPFPNMPDILGGGVEEGESPEEAAAREMAEELVDLRTDEPFVLRGHKPFRAYTDQRGCEQHIFECLIDFEISDLRLLEGKGLIWLTEVDLDSGMKLAFEFEGVLKDYFLQQQVG